MSDRQLELRREQLLRQVEELQSRREREGTLPDWHADRLAQLEDLLAAA